MAVNRGTGRVWVFCGDGLCRAIDCEFKRRKDAEIGLAELERQGLTTEAALYAVHPKLKAIMCAAFPW